jgi:hypothetical protein
VRQLVTLLSLLWTWSLWGTTYYISPSGNNGNDGVTRATPWLWDRGVAALTNGNLVIALSGTYTTQITIPAGVGSPPATPAILRSDVRWGAIVSVPSGYGIVTTFTPFVTNIWIDGFCVTNCGNVSNTGQDGIGTSGSGIVVTNCWIKDNNGQGINNSHPANSNNIVDRCLVEGNGRISFGQGGPANAHYHGYYGAGPGMIVRNSVFRNNCSGAGIQYYTGSAASMNGSAFYNNLVYGHTNFFGIITWNAVDPGQTQPGTNYIFGNTVLDGISDRYGGSGVSNNIILPSASQPSSPLYTTAINLAADYNVGTNTLTGAAHDVVTTYTGLGFQNPSAGKYWLTLGSAARSVAAPLICGPVDFFGNFQSSVVDAGAFRYSAVLAGDVRTLEPSPAGGADYWASLAVAPMLAVNGSLVLNGSLVVSAPSVGGGFLDLRTLTNAVLYCDINTNLTNISGLQASYNDSIQAWGDISINGTNALQMLAAAANTHPTLVSTNGPTNGPSLLFDALPGTGRSLTNKLAGVSLPQPNTYFMVVRLDVSGYDNYSHGAILFDPMDASQSSQLNFANISSLNSGHIYAGGSDQVLYASGADAISKGWPLTGWFILTLQFNGASTIVRINGVPYPIGAPTTYNPGSGGAQGFRLGAAFNGNGPAAFWICSVLWTSGGTMAVENMLQVEESLGHEFGITVP